MISKSEDEYEYEITESYDYDENLSLSENIIASRKCSFDDLDSDYLDALREISMQIDCPLCHRKKRQLCVNCMNGEPAHKSRMKLIKFASKKVEENVYYAMKSKRWKGDRVVITINGKWQIIECSDPKWKEKVNQWKEQRAKY